MLDFNSIVEFSKGKNYFSVCLTCQTLTDYLIQQKCNSCQLSKKTVKTLTKSKKVEADYLQKYCSIIREWMEERNSLLKQKLEISPLKITKITSLRKNVPEENLTITLKNSYDQQSKVRPTVKNFYLLELNNKYLFPIIHYLSEYTNKNDDENDNDSNSDDNDSDESYSDNESDSDSSYYSYSSDSSDWSDSDESVQNNNNIRNKVNLPSPQAINTHYFQTRDQYILYGRRIIKRLPKIGEVFTLPESKIRLIGTLPGITTKSRVRPSLLDYGDYGYYGYYGYHRYNNFDYYDGIEGDIDQTLYLVPNNDNGMG